MGGLIEHVISHIAASRISAIDILLLKGFKDTFLIPT